MFLEQRIEQNMLYAEDCTIDKFIYFVAGEESDYASLRHALEQSGIIV